MPAKFPFAKWFWADWFRDTRCLSATARGVWIDVIGYLSEHTQTGSATYTKEEWSRVLTVTVSDLDCMLSECQKFQICAIVRKTDDLVTLTCRRLKREKQARKSATLRQAQYSKKMSGDASVTNSSRPGDGDIHIQRHIQSQKQMQSQRKKKKDSPPVSPPLRGGIGRRERLEQFSPDDDLRTWAKDKFGITDLSGYLDEFRDYWRSVPDAKLRQDWPATFRNRLRQLAEVGRLKPADTLAAWAAEETDDESAICH